mgnify:CR=1 FL=1
MKVWPQPPALGKSKLEAILRNRLERSGLGSFVTEYKFHPTRRWRLDVAFVSQKVAIECEGGGWAFGRHTRGKGFASDLRKYAEALALGWVVLRVDGAMIEDNSAVEYVKRIMIWRGE